MGRNKFETYVSIPILAERFSLRVNVLNMFGNNVISFTRNAVVSDNIIWWKMCCSTPTVHLSILSRRMHPFRSDTLTPYQITTRIVTLSVIKSTKNMMCLLSFTLFEQVISIGGDFDWNDASRFEMIVRRSSSGPAYLKLWCAE